MPERVHNGEIWTRDTTHASITFAEYSSLEDAGGNPIPMLDALNMHLREYTEVPYYRGEMHREFGMQGPSVMVGAYKTAILRKCVEWLKDGNTEPLPFKDVVGACEDAAPFDLWSVDEISYVLHPDSDKADKPRLPYRPDFDTIHKYKDILKPREWYALLAFYESLYALQKFAAGIRDDIFGGSKLVEPPKSRAVGAEEFTPPIPESLKQGESTVTEQLGELSVGSTTVIHH